MTTYSTDIVGAYSGHYMHDTESLPHISHVIQMQTDLGKLFSGDTAALLPHTRTSLKGNTNDALSLILNAFKSEWADYQDSRSNTSFAYNFAHKLESQFLLAPGTINLDKVKTQLNSSGGILDSYDSNANLLDIDQYMDLLYQYKNRTYDTGKISFVTCMDFVADISSSVGQNTNYHTKLYWQFNIFHVASPTYYFKMGDNYTWAIPQGSVTFSPTLIKALNFTSGTAYTVSAKTKISFGCGGTLNNSVSKPDPQIGTLESLTTTIGSLTSDVDNVTYIYMEIMQ